MAKRLSWNIFLVNQIFPYPTVFRNQFSPWVVVLGVGFLVEAFVDLWFESKYFITVFIFKVNTLMWCFIGKHSRLPWFKYCLALRTLGFLVQEKYLKGHHHGSVRRYKVLCAEHCAWQSFAFKGYFHSYYCFCLGRRWHQSRVTCPPGRCW